MVKIKNLIMKYGNSTVIKNINLNINKNSTCAIIGPSGCGKSTLLYGIAGILKPFSGEILINNFPVKENRKKTGLILQNYGLLPWKTVWNNVSLGLTIRGYHKKDIQYNVDKVLRELDVYDLKDRYPIELSGGQRQRIAIARALTISPDLLLMDEPFSSLDAISRENLQNLILKIHKENNITLILVTHNIEEAVFLGQTIVIMGQKFGEIKNIINNPYFGDEELRYKSDYYKICMEVRQLMRKDEIK
ncbi:ABC transporter ATP-binding protein [Defluviitalea phaphyphila]|uniref:ABC transporter ATP-binding protein n=1 Tax=Defluviitalea phaphyphila TaxID=1473580 RepID=UPI000730F868|nr:ABC transporter ATP-binding protein [Defluviitalea phaphyphila]